MAELLAKISPETYHRYVHHNCGNAYIYAKLNVALYGTLKVAILSGKICQKASESMVFPSTCTTGVWLTK